jgi:hypothetical protein
MPALAGMTLLLSACHGGGPPIRSQVLTPPPATPSAQFFVEKAEVQSRETGDEAWRRNQEYARLLTESLRAALQGAGKVIAPPPATVVRPRIYLAWNDPPVKNGEAQGEKARVEIRLQLLDPETKAVRYSTLTQSAIAPSAIVGYKYGDDRDQNVRKALDAAVADFVSRL